MSPEKQVSVEEAFRALETQLAALQASAKSLRDDRPSWTDNVFHPGRRARQEADFSTALVSALKEFRVSISNAISAAIHNAISNVEAHQNSRVADLERQLSELRTEQLASLEKGLREQHDRLAREQAESAANATNRLAELREQVDKMQSELASRQNELASRQNELASGQKDLASGQKDLANEFRERLQHLLDEQRVAIRQLALKASEDAVLSDRARRATELKLEELAKRLPPA